MTQRNPSPWYDSEESLPRYDSEGVGQSKMPDAAQLSFKKWYEDACYVVEHLTDGPQMIVSSSNGGQLVHLSVDIMDQGFK